MEEQEKQQEQQETRRKNLSGVFLMLGGLVLIAAAVALVLFNRIQDANAGNEAALILNELEKSTSFSMLEMPDAEMPVVSIGGIDYVGELVIEHGEEEPLKLPVMAAWDDVYSWTAPGRYAGSAYDDTMVVCGHNMPSHFAILPSLVEGDPVTFTDVNGNVFHYNVAQIYNLKPTQVADMVTGDWDLTLFTCNLSGNERVTVRCLREE